MRPSLWPRGEPTDSTSRAKLNFALPRGSLQAGKIPLAGRRAGGIVGTKLKVA